MSGHQSATLGDTVYFWFAANDTSGSGNDGASAVYDVREAGAAADAAPLLSGSATLLSHANYPAGCYEVAVAATSGNGFAAADTFAAFATLAVDSQNPTGIVGSCTLTPLATAASITALDTVVDRVEADTQDIQSRLPAALVNSRMDSTIDATGFEDAAVDKVWDETMAGHTTADTSGLVMNEWQNGGRLDLIVDAILADTNELQGDDVPGLISTLDAVVDTVKAETVLILADTGELQGDWANGGRLDLLLDAIPTTAMRGTDSAATATNLATVDTVVDAIKAVTDQMVFTKANELDANTQSINGAAVTGDGDATPWDGA